MKTIGNKLAKMDETSIVAAYSRYMQQVVLVLENCRQPACPDFLSYEEFKDYYILKLVGKDDYLDKVIRQLQAGI